MFIFEKNTLLYDDDQHIEECAAMFDNQKLVDDQKKTLAESILLRFDGIFVGFKNDLVSAWCFFNVFADMQKTLNEKMQLSAQYQKSNFNKERLPATEHMKALLLLLHSRGDERTNIDQQFRISEMGHELKDEHIEILADKVAQYCTEILEKLPKTVEFRQECERKKIEVERFSVSEEKLSKLRPRSLSQSSASSENKPQPSSDHSLKTPKPTRTERFKNLFKKSDRTSPSPQQQHAR